MYLINNSSTINLNNIITFRVNENKIELTSSNKILFITLKDIQEANLVYNSILNYIDTGMTSLNIQHILRYESGKDN